MPDFIHQAETNKHSVKPFSFYTPFLMLLSFFLLASTSPAQLTVNAGSGGTICSGDSIKIGDFPAAYGGTFPYTYSWSPTKGLDNPNIANPIAFPLTTTVYVLTVKDAAGAKASSSITIEVAHKPSVDAGADTTIQEGSVAILHAHGASIYRWTPAPELKYTRTAFAETSTTDTATYYVTGYDITGTCSSIDSVIVYVVPGNKIIVYNTFTPNGDLNNDTWYIGNIEKYPENHLEIYNRYGKKVFEMYNYDNSWNGRTFGEKLPASTYFYVLDLGDGSPTYHGTVTIVD